MPKKKKVKKGKKLKKVKKLKLHNKAKKSPKPLDKKNTIPGQTKNQKLKKSKNSLPKNEFTI